MRGEWLRKPAARVSVVFVHGILSSGDTCWRNENGSDWPALLRHEPKLESLGIYVFTYKTGIFSGSYSLGDVVDALKEHMRLDDVFLNRLLIFVCHSMGGIVVRKLVVQRAMDLVDAGTEVGLFLVASPSLGAAYADWLSPLADFLDHTQVDALRFVRDNQWLHDLDRDFTNLKESGRLAIRGKELVEDSFIVFKKVLRRQVVEPFAGAKYFGHPFKVPGSDHFSIAKPESSSAIQHRLLVEFIEGMVNSGHAKSAHDRAFLVLDTLEREIEALHYSPREASVRFTVTNLSRETVKIKMISLNVARREAVRLFRLPTPGAPCSEFTLRADISDADSIDLLAATHAQFVLQPGETDAFLLSIIGAEGFRYEAEIGCTALPLSGTGNLLCSSAAIRLTYPIRTVRGISHGK